MHQRILIGCCSVGRNRRRYFERFSALEYQQSFFQPPGPAVLRRLHQQAPPGFAFIIKAWQTITHECPPDGYPRLSQAPTQASGPTGHFRPSTAVAEAFQRTQEIACILDAEAILFETPASFTPSTQNRRQLARFFEGIDRQHRIMVWNPQGVWSPGEVLGACADLDLIPCWDPLVSSVQAPGCRAYIKLTGMGAFRRYTDGQLHALVDALTPYEQAYCIFHTETMFKDAKRLLSIIHMDFR